MQRLDRHRYYMRLAEAVSEGADCLGRSVGSVIVRDNRVVSTGATLLPPALRPGAP